MQSETLTSEFSALPVSYGFNTNINCNCKLGLS